jgi:hypothetical protein
MKSMSAVRAFLVLVVAAGIVALLPGNAWACSCRTTDTTAQVRRAGTVVDGTVEWVANNGMESTYSVKVDQVFKGKAAAREKLVGPASEASCGLGTLVADERYLFFIDGVHPGQMKVDLCGGSARYDAATAAAVQAVTGAPGGPVPAPAVRSVTDKDPDAGTRWFTVGGSALVVALVLGGLLWFARRTRR